MKNLCNMAAPARTSAGNVSTLQTIKRVSLKCIKAMISRLLPWPHAGRCPGIGVVKLGMMLAKQGVDAIHLAGCMIQEVECPYFDADKIAREIENKSGVHVVVGIE